MANAMINGWTLDINPSEASWSYALQTKSQDTYGGRVIQILSCKVDSFTVKGYLPTSKPKPGGSSDTRWWAPMEAFEQKVKSIMAYHANNQKPVPFRFDALDWEGDVYLTGYSDVEYSSALAAVSYTLRFTVDSGFDTISQEVADSVKVSLGNIKDGIDYSYNEYNTPTAAGWESVKSALEKAIGDSANYSTDSKSIYEYISELSDSSNGDSSDSSNKTENGSSDESYSSDDSSSSSGGSWLDGIVSFFTGGN